MWWFCAELHNIERCFKYCAPPILVCEYVNMVDKKIETQNKDELSIKHNVSYIYSTM